MSPDPRKSNPQPSCWKAALRPCVSRYQTWCDNIFLSLLTATFVNEQIKWRLFGHYSGWMSSALGAFLCCCSRESCGRRHYIFELSIRPYLSPLHSAVDVLSEWRQHVSHWETVCWNYTCHFTSISLKTHLNIRTMEVYFYLQCSLPEAFAIKFLQVFMQNSSFFQPVS